MYTHEIREIINNPHVTSNQIKTIAMQLSISIHGKTLLEIKRKIINNIDRTDGYARLLL